jgi:hypothetical protein
MTTSPVARLFDRVSRVYDTPALQALVYRPTQDLALRRLRDARVKRVSTSVAGRVSSRRGV